jgi:hypothetical protein
MHGSAPGPKRGAGAQSLEDILEGAASFHSNLIVKGAGRATRMAILSSLLVDNVRMSMCWATGV